MPRSLIKIVIFLGVIGLLALLAFGFLFTTSSSSDKPHLSLSNVEIAGNSVSLCLDDRITTPEAGLIDFSLAPSTKLKEFEGFARQYSRYFMTEPTNSQSNGSQISAAKRCKSISRDKSNKYVMGAGSGQERTAYDVYVEGGSVVHIDGFYINNEKK